jgi:PAS domain S-box-containing protein
MNHTIVDDQSIVLIVDDDAVVRQVLQQLLAGEGYRLAFAANGAEALVRALELDPDLILLDLLMPDISGFEVCRRLRADPHLAEVPIIMVTALGDPNSRLRGFEAGADDFITKPFEPVELLARMRTTTRLNRYRRLHGERMHREQAEQTLRETHKLLAATFASLDEAVFVVDPTSRTVLACNPAVERVFDYTVDEVLGHNTEFLHVNRSMYQEFGRKLYPALDAEGVFHSEFQMQRKDGSVFFSEHTVTEILDENRRRTGAVSVVRDITERKRTEQALRESEERYRDFVESTEDLVTQVDATGHFSYVNAAARTILGLSPEECIGLPVLDFVHPDDRERTREVVRQWARDGATSTTLENRQVSRTGQVRHILWTVSHHCDGQGKLMYSNGIGRDITKREEAEQALHRSLEETAHAHRLLLALSQAAEAVQSAHTLDELYHSIGEGLASLGYQSAIFTLTEDRAYLALSHLNADPDLIERAQKLTGLSGRDFQFPLMPGGFYQEVIGKGETTFEPTTEHFAEALPEAVRPLGTRLMALIGWERSIVAPLTVRAEVFGLLAVSGASLTEADVPAVTAFAHQASIAIENTQLFEEVRSGHGRLQILSRRLVEAQETERRRIARELHDEIGQILAGIKLILEMSARLPAEAIRDSLDELRGLVDELITRVRDLSLDLRPPMLDDLGLLATLPWHFDRYTTLTQVRVTFKHANLHDRRFTAGVETAAYRIVQEALTNVARHAGANEAEVRMWVDRDLLHVEVQDQGKGFDVQAALASGTSGGLAGMFERARLLGGRIAIESSPAEGTSVKAELPLGGPQESSGRRGEHDDPHSGR